MCVGRAVVVNDRLLLMLGLLQKHAMTRHARSVWIRAEFTVCVVPTSIAFRMMHPQWIRLGVCAAARPLLCLLFQSSRTVGW